MSKGEIFEKVQELAGLSHKVASEMDLGPDRVEMFSISNVLRKLTRKGFAEEVEHATNPLLRELRGDFDEEDEPEDWDSDFWEEEEEDE